MTRNKKRLVLYCFVNISILFGAIVCFWLKSEADEFMKTARVVRADVIVINPFGDRIVRFSSDGQDVELPLTTVVGPKRTAEVGQQIEIAFVPTRPKEVRWMPNMNIMRIGGLWLGLLNNGLVSIGSIQIWKLLQAEPLSAQT